MISRITFGRTYPCRHNWRVGSWARTSHLDTRLGLEYCVPPMCQDLADSDRDLSTDCWQAEIPFVCRFLMCSVCRQCALFASDYCDTQKLCNRGPTDYDTVEKTQCWSDFRITMCQNVDQLMSNNAVTRSGRAALHGLSKSNTR